MPDNTFNVPGFGKRDPDRVEHELIQRVAFTAQEFANLIGREVSTIRRNIIDGKIPCVKVSGVNFVPGRAVANLWAGRDIWDGVGDDAPDGDDKPRVR